MYNNKVDIKQSYSKSMKLPFAISNNCVIVEAICLQLNEIDVETIYTLGYILKLYPSLRSLKSISKHCSDIQQRLGNAAEIDSVIHLHLLTSNVSYKRIFDVSNITLYNYAEGSGSGLASMKLWEIYFTRNSQLCDYSILDCLVKSGEILASEADRYAARKIRNVVFTMELRVRVIADIWCDLEERFIIGSTNINTERFEMIYPEIGRTFWSVVKNVFMKIVKLEVDIPYAIENVTLYIECCL